MSRTYRAGFLACGLGAGAKGFAEATARLGIHEARFEIAGGVDIDLAGLADFRYLTGAPGTVGDLHTMQPADLVAAWGPDAPDVVFSSTPCKGLSRLLGAAAAATAHYQALNALTLEAFHLVCATYSPPPKLLLLENVPGLRTRGADLLVKLRAILSTFGYVFDESTHDCGEIGGLGQHRRRFLLVARHAKTLPGFLYSPPKQRVKACGEIIGPLPLPNDPAAGGLHALPRISWINWARLALIPPGGDWRDLPRAITTQPENENAHENKHAVGEWSKPARAVIGATRPGSGAASVADARVSLGRSAEQNVFERRGLFGVDAWNSPAPAVAGRTRSTGGSVPGNVADPRLVVGKTGDNADGFKGRPGYLGVQSFEDPAIAVIGKASVSGSSGRASIADPRLTSPLAPGQPHREVIRRYPIAAYGEPFPTVTGSGANAVESIADPRVAVTAWDGKHARKYQVRRFDEPSSTVTGDTDIQEGAPNVADSRVSLGCTPRSGSYGVAALTQPLDTVTGSASIDNGRVAIADDRVHPPLPPGYMVMTLEEVLAEATSPKAKPAPGVIPVIFSPTDGTWHRPLTTLELAALQGIPTVVDGAPLQLAGKSAASHRERIGNAVPVGAAKAIAGEMLRTLLAGSLGLFMLSATAIWVDHPYRRRKFPRGYPVSRREREPAQVAMEVV